MYEIFGLTCAVVCSKIRSDLLILCVSCELFFSLIVDRDPVVCLNRFIVIKIVCFPASIFILFKITDLRLLVTIPFEICESKKHIESLF
jgi:hypothetical protein